MRAKVYLHGGLGRGGGCQAGDGVGVRWVYHQCRQALVARRAQLLQC